MSLIAQMAYSHTVLSMCCHQKTVAADAADDVDVGVAVVAVVIVWMA